MQIRIRSLRIEDSRSSRFHYLEDLLSFSIDRAIFYNNNSVILGIFDNDLLIGFAIGDYKRFQKIYELGFLAIRPEYQGQGLGRKLIKEFEKMVAEKGYKELQVGTMWSYGVRRFYHRMGYKLFEVDKEFRCSLYRKVLCHG